MHHNETWYMQETEHAKREINEYAESILKWAKRFYDESQEGQYQFAHTRLQSISDDLLKAQWWLGRLQAVED